MVQKREINISKITRVEAKAAINIDQKEKLERSRKSIQAHVPFVRRKGACSTGAFKSTAALDPEVHFPLKGPDSNKHLSDN